MRKGYNVNILNSHNSRSGISLYPWTLKTLSVLIALFAQVGHLPSAEKQETKWDFTEASTIINSIEQKIGAQPATRDLVPLLHNVKRHLVDFARSSTKNNTNLTIPALNDFQPSNREVINRKDSKEEEEEVNTSTFKGHKVIHMSDDVEGRLGQWTVLKAMEKLLDTIPSKVTAAERICRPGPIHWAHSSHKSTDKKCLIMGDSISIGYMDYVSEMLEGDCTVHHAPWAGDGGSLDTSYILQCLPMFLSSSFYEPVHYDAIIFNSGLHDVDCCDFHSEYVPLKEYSKNLKKIKKALLKSGAVVAFATSTPIPYNKTINKRLLQYNKAAKKIMKEGKPIKVVDLYNVIMKECDGSAEKCNIFEDQPNVHLTGSGYLSLASAVSREFNRLLKRDKKEKKQKNSKQVKQEDAPPGSLYCIPKTRKGNHNVHNLTGCPSNTTCCLNEYSNSFVGCCMLKDAMDCGDSWHCCPKGTVCDPGCTGKGCICRKAPWESKATRTTFSLLMNALNVFWNKIAKNYPSLEKS